MNRLLNLILVLILELSVAKNYNSGSYRSSNYDEYTKKISRSRSSKGKGWTSYPTPVPSTKPSELHSYIPGEVIPETGGAEGGTSGHSPTVNAPTPGALSPTVQIGGATGKTISL